MAWLLQPLPMATAVLFASIATVSLMGCGFVGSPDLCAEDPSCTELSEDIVPPGLFAANDGPYPYQLWKLLNDTEYATTEDMADKYVNFAGFKSVRLDEAGRAFHLPCMFPVSDASNIPDPMDDANWDWTYADFAFKALIDHGIAPMLKIPVSTWQSTRIAGLNHRDGDGNVEVKIDPSDYADCKPWPTTSGVIMARKNGVLVGTQLALKIVQRYNDPNNFPVKDRQGGALDASTFQDAFNGIELMNEWSSQYCFPYGRFPKSRCPKDGSLVDEDMYSKYCFGKPYTWGTRYWDGSPEEAWAFYVDTAIAIKSQFSNIRVGGPATGTGPIFFTCSLYEGMQQEWIEGFLKAVKDAQAPLDFFSFHYYGLGQNQTNNLAGQIADLDYLHRVFRTSIENADLVHLQGEVPFALTEFNAPFMPGNRSRHVGSISGAASNAAKIAQLVAYGDVHGAFLYTGRDGAFEPGNPFSFPLSCPAQWWSQNESCRFNKTTLLEEVEECHKGCKDAAPSQKAQPYDHCGPDDVWVPKVKNLPENADEDPASWYANRGYWGASCSTVQVSSDVRNLSGCTDPQGDEKCQFGSDPHSGMGSLYATDDINPTGMMYHMLKSAGGSQKLRLAPEVVKTLQYDALVYALAWQDSSGDAMLMLSNPQETAVTYDDMPSAVQLLGTGVTGTMSGEVLLQTTREGNLVDALDGFDSQVPLHGITESYTKYYGELTVNNKLPKLDAFAVIVLRMKLDGCMCPARLSVERAIV